MRILWVCNFMLPAVAQSLGIEPVNKEGWISGLFDSLRRDDTCNLQLAVCFPIPDSLKKICESDDAEGRQLLTGQIEGASYFGFLEDTVNLQFYDYKVQRQLEKIIGQFRPDLVHIFGTEYPHALAAAKAWGRPDRTLVGLQGIVRSCVAAYDAELPDAVINHVTFRDWLKKDSIVQQKEKFGLRAEHERQLLELTLHVTGRTAFDREQALAMHPGVHYHFMNETMRDCFYDGSKWSPEHCERHSIFVSQGNYPLKGLHKVLEALPLVLEYYPDAKLYVAGDPITAYRTWKDKLKISSYGKYLLSLLKKLHLTGRVTFLGKLDAEQMKERFLRSHVFVSASSMENSSNSVGEAMLLGVPVVTSRVGGLTSMLDDEKEGLFYDFSNVTALAKRILRIFEDDALAAELSANARKRAWITHDPKQNAERLLAVYQEVMEA